MNDDYWSDVLLIVIFVCVTAFVLAAALGVTYEVVTG